ncbi:MAG TPA: TIGR03435 family protein [Candidatus Aquilonibacter sp.]|nr:TIGR03435 family protein [Candidatus Aquilonibacter sp.]
MSGNRAARYGVSCGMPFKKSCARLLLLAAACFGLAISASAQIIHASGPLPSFEVATIKPASPQPLPSSASPAEVRISNVTVRNLVEQAYGVPWTSAENERVLGGPAWLDANHYDIVARIPGDLAEAQQKLSRDEQKRQISLMLQSLLAERFHLKVHFETKVLTVYALVVARPKPGLVESTRHFESSESSESSAQANDVAIRLPSKPEDLRHGILVLYNGQMAEMTARQASMDDLARWFAGYSEVGGRPVVNETGLSGLYDFSLRWMRQSLAGTSPGGLLDAADAPPLFTALPEQLGLRLKSDKAPVEVILIDRADPPTDN